jgi:hypothetical protein
MQFSNLLIIAGTGNKSGKTTLACRIIEQFRQLNVFSVKITPHFHETTPGLILIEEKNHYSIYEETNPGTNKDTSRMLKCGAVKVFFAKTTDSSVLPAFEKIYSLIPAGVPVICESPALRKFIEPGLFIIMTAPDEYNKKNISNLWDLPHVPFDMEYISRIPELPVVFTNSRWRHKVNET